MAYRRGLRGLGIACSAMPPVSSTFQGPFDCSGSQSDVPRFDAAGVPATQGDIDALWNFVLGQAQSPAQSLTDWLNANSTTLLIGSGVFLGVMLLAKGMR